MNHKFLTRGLLAAGIALASSAQAADVRINGFASIAVGKTISEEDLPPLIGGKSVYRVDPTNSDNDQSYYDDDLSFNPDTNYGIQFSSDLGDGLSLTAQLTAKGGNDFEAEIEWAYASYELNDEVTLQAGRMRLPLYHYSDFLDVGYAYHWLRAPIGVYAEGVSIYNGIAARYNTYIGDWDISTSFHAGNGKNDGSEAGETHLDDYMGLVFNAYYDWLQIRVSHHVSDIWVDDTIADDDNAHGISFSSAAIFGNFGNGFIGTEFTQLNTDDDDEPLPINNFTGGIDLINDTLLEKRQAWMITAGYRFGSLTPHITFTDRQLTLSDNQTGLLAGAAGKKNASQTWIAGVRWDFHPAAAIKFEYTDRSEESDDEVTDVAGKANEVSTFAVGLDLIF